MLDTTDTDEVGKAEKKRATEGPGNSSQLPTLRDKRYRHKASAYYPKNNIQ